MSTIETTCRRCGRTFTPDHRAILAGVWRACPACRGSPDTTRTSALSDYTGGEAAGDEERARSTKQ